jgi:Flp pilus assembly protein TadD
LSYLRHRQGDRREAITLLEKALDLKPDFWRGANDLAYLLAEDKADSAGLDRALQLALQARNFAPEEPSVLDTLGWVQYRRGNLDEARQWVLQALAASPDNAVINYHMGMIALDMGQKEQARQYLEKSLVGAEDFSGREEAEKALKKI